MGIIHFLNVREGACSWIKHASGNVSVIDVCNGNDVSIQEKIIYSSLNDKGNYNQKEHPVNPIEYLKKFDVKEIFRFILTHPDMDHIDGIKNLFDNFTIINFWDTNNFKEMKDESEWGRYKKEDWDFYQDIRKSNDSPKVLQLYAGSIGQYFNKNADGKIGGDGIYILAPTNDLVCKANENKHYNDLSYVLLYRTKNGKKILFAGDSEDKTWNYILEHHKEEVKDIDVLIAPHHGRKTGGNDEYLDTLNPKLTLFGNASSSDLDYGSWNRRGLDHITNNQANCVILDAEGEKGIDVYVQHKPFAKKRNPDATHSLEYDAWYIMTI